MFYIYSNIEEIKPAFTEEDLEDIVFSESSQAAAVEKPVYDDIDNDTTDEFAVAEYANEIFRNMKKQEVQLN